MLFKNIIPMDMLVNLPQVFVNKLRDIRIKELQEQKRQLEESTAAKNAGNMPAGPLPSGLPLLGSGGLSDVLDEYT